MFFRNVWRTVLKNKFSYIGVVLIISMGVLVYVAMADYLGGMRDAAELYYQRTNFADVFAVVERMPESAVRELEEIEGVAEAFGRLEQDVRWIKEDDSRIIAIHLMAWAADDSVNKLYLLPEGGGPAGDEIYLDPSMARAHGLQYGDQITVAVNGVMRSLRYQGDAFSPECMAMTPDSSIFAPDYAVYDMAAMEKGSLERLLGEKGMVNHIGLKLREGFTYSDVKYNVEQLLQKYGLSDICARKDNAGYYAVKSEIDTMSAFQDLIPPLFLGVSILLLYIMLKKIIDMDRIVIGTMKAFGGTNAELLRAYSLQGVAIGLLGGLLPLPAAEIAAEYLLEDDALYYNLPLLEPFSPSPAHLAAGVAISLGTTMLSILLAMLGVLRIKPAESMRVSPPSVSGVSLPKALAAILNTRQKIALRAIFRSPLRSFIIAIAVAFPFMVLAVVGEFSVSVIRDTLNQYAVKEKYDLKVTLPRMMDQSLVEASIKTLDNVESGEAVANHTSRITARNRSVYTGLQVLNPGSDCFRILDADGVFHEPDDSGLLVNALFAKKLNIKPGDVIEVSGAYLTGPDRTVRIPVLALVREYSGGGCYISPEGIERYFNVPPMSNIMLLRTAEGKEEDVRRQLSGMGNVLFVAESEELAMQSAEALSTLVVLMRGIAVFSVVAGAVMIYNIMSISMRERRTEFGTLMVLGISNAELTEIVVFEQVINFTVGILLGIPGVRLLTAAVESAFETSDMSYNLRVTPQFYLLAFVVVTAVVAVTVWRLLCAVRGIQLSDILKERE